MGSSTVQSPTVLKKKLALATGAALIGAQSGYSVEQELTGRITFEAFGAIGNGVADDTAALQLAFNTGLALTGKAGAVYRLTDTVLTTNKNIDVFAPNRSITFLDDTDTGQLFYFLNNLGATQIINSIGKGKTPNNDNVTSLTLATTTHGYKAGDVLKIVSDDLISAKANERQGEFMEVILVDGAEIRLAGNLIQNMVTNPRCAKLDETRRFSFSGVEFDAVDENIAVGAYAYALQPSGYYQPRYEHIRFTLGRGIGILNHSCFGAHGFDISCKKLVNNIAEGSYGYVATDKGSQNSTWWLYAERCRHGYTEGCDSTNVNDSNLRKYGGGIQNTIKEMRGISTSSICADTHESAIQTVFDNVTITQAPSGLYSSGGLQHRGRDFHVKHFTMFANGSEDAGFAITGECGDAHIERYDYYGEDYAIARYGTTMCNIRIDQFNYHMQSGIRATKISNGINLFIDEMNVYLLEGATSNNLSPVFEFGGGKLHVKRINWYMRGSPVEITNSPTLVKLNNDCESIIIEENVIYCDANSWSQGKMRILDGNDNTPASFYCKTIVHFDEWDGETRNGTQFLQDVADTSGVINNFELYKNNVLIASPAVINQVLHSGDMTIRHGLDYYPMQNQLIQFNEPVIECTIWSHFTDVVVTSILAPAFEGQRMNLYCDDIGNGVITSNDFQISATCANVRTGGAVKTIPLGGRATLIAKEMPAGTASGAGLLWQVYQ
jgi:hypothetical protein